LCTGTISPDDSLPITESIIEVDARKGEVPEVDCADVGPTPSATIAIAARPTDSINVAYLIVSSSLRAGRALRKDLWREFVPLFIN